MKRKHILISAVLLGMSLSLGSCSDYLDVEQYFKDRQTLEKTFQSRDYTDRWLANVYSKLEGCNEEICSKGYTPFNFSDDMFWGDRDGSYVPFKKGTYDEGAYQDTWGRNYEAIRDASTLIDNIHINQELYPSEIVDYRAQARFLRAYYYWLLLRKYGPIPLIPEHGLDFTASYDDLQLPRNTYDECVKFIADEFALAAQDLPLNRSNQEIARPTRGAALAARAKVLLFAASPLFNGNTEMAELKDDKGRNLIAQEYDEKKWALAAAAALDVMNLRKYRIYTSPFRSESDASRDYPATIIPPHNDLYSEKSFPSGTGFDAEGGWKDIDPFESYRAVFNGALTASANPELIFTRGNNQSSEGIEIMALHQMPYSLSGWGAHGLTQKQVDAYYMDDGKDVPGMHDYMDADYPDRNTEPRVSGYIETDEDVAANKPLLKGCSKQYAHREPRFYASVAYNGCMWEVSSSREDLRYQQVFWYRGTTDGFNTENAFYYRTGFGVKKFIHPTDSWRTDGTRQKKMDTTLRYAEVLLNYAEALNELTGEYQIPSWDGATTYTIDRNQQNMKMALLPIRLRAGLPNYSDDIYSNADLLRKSIKRERQIELLAEGHRYWDIRRWKDAPREEATPIYGCNMNMTEAHRDLFYTPHVVSSLPTVFSFKTYLWPINHDELRKNKRLTQNPGWTYPY